MKDCGGCQGIGSHRRICPDNPNYDYRLVLADEAESLGDRIGSNYPELANECYYVAGTLRRVVEVEKRLYYYPDGRVDADGVAWYRTDGYGGWFRWEDSDGARELITEGSPVFDD